jgi:PTS system N-acetylglucosamine-specific IIC component
MKALFAQLQRIGGALMLPIAVLPIAALLLRLGQPDLLGVATVAAAGQAVFDNLGLLFAIGVAVGLARENHGAAGLAAVVGYLVATQGAQILIVVPSAELAGFSGSARDLASAAYKSHELAKLSVPLGMLCGLSAGVLYNRFSGIKLPSYLAFFGGRRFVPIVTGLAGLVLAFLFGWEWQQLEAGMDTLSRAVLHAGPLGLFVFGLLNRILIVTGLHHILNNLAWFLLGDFHGVTGDLKRFFAGDPAAGAFMSGFFPVMMFGLPAACLAMYHCARPERRAAVGGLLGSMALTALLTGVTEPVEFSFMFLAPGLYAVHAVLTGAAMALMNVLQVRLGFGFSAGLFDYLLNYSKATRPLLLLPVGMLYAVTYYGLFRWAILRFDLATPGREPEEAAAAAGPPQQEGEPARAYIEALGGAANLASVDACTTRLRLTLADPQRAADVRLRQLGARGVVRPGGNALQVIVGPIADQLAGQIRAALRAAPAGPVVQPLQVPAAPTPPPAGPWPAAPTLLAALGGAQNVREVRAAGSRLRLWVREPARLELQALRGLGARGVATPSAGCVHIILGPEAAAAAAALQSLLSATG